jgi:single-stranded DNA-binding protein
VEILNQIILAGNLTDQPSVSDAGGRQFVRARLAQNWFYDTQGRTVEHRQFLPITFFGESAIVAKTFQKGDNIHVTGQLIRREPRPRTDGESRRPRSGHHLRDSCHSRIPYRRQLEIGNGGHPSKRDSSHQRRQADSGIPSGEHP